MPRQFDQGRRPLGFMQCEHGIKAAVQAVWQQVVEHGLLKPLNILIPQRSGQCHDGRKPRLQVVGCCRLIDTFEQAQNRTYLAQSHPEVMQKFSVQVRDDASFVAARDGNMACNDRRGSIVSGLIRRQDQVRFGRIVGLRREKQAIQR